MNEETIDFKSEIERQNIIIKVLTEKVILLEKKLAKNKGDNGQKEFPLSNTTRDSDQNESTLSNTTRDSDQKINHLSDITRNSDQKVHPLSGTTNNSGQSVRPLSNITDQSTGIIPVLPEKIYGRSGFSLKMKELIITDLGHNSKRRFFRHATAILLFLYNNPQGSYEEMRKAGRMSYSGFAKHFKILRTKGWVKREAFQKYMLTEKGKEMIQNSFINSQTQ